MAGNMFQLSEFHITALYWIENQKWDQVNGLKHIVETVQFYLRLSHLNVAIGYVVLFQVVEFGMVQGRQFCFAYVTVHVKKGFDVICIRRNGVWNAFPFR